MSYPFAAHFGQRLTPRELEIARLYRYPAKVQAQKLGLSLSTVKVHRRNLRLKLGLTSLRDLVSVLNSHPQLKILEYEGGEAPGLADLRQQITIPLADLICPHCRKPLGTLVLNNPKSR
jgi:DNA-binding CsgD family transcriptional regulator